jgi:TrmH family RNA methyltransferase
LRHRKYRHREGHFLVEGIRAVLEAHACDAPVETLIYAPELLVSEQAAILVEKVDPDRRLTLSGDVFRTLSDRKEPQGIIALVRIEGRSLGDIPQSDELLVVVAYQLRDPGNLGSIIRTADAAGATGVVIVEPSVDLYDPRTVRATMGSLFALPIVRLKDHTALESWYTEIRGGELDLLVVASSAHGRQVHFDLDYNQPVVLLCGSERHGIPHSLQGTADATVRLPMLGRATSLNVSAATAAMIYEIVRQRGTKLPGAVHQAR